MFQVNHVTLIGVVVDSGRILRRASSYGGSVLTFVLRTAEIWRGKNDTSCEHYEYHQVVLKDSASGSYRMASRFGPLIQEGRRLLVSGKLRYRMYRESNGLCQRTSEIEADGVEWLSDELPEAQLPAAR